MQLINLINIKLTYARVFVFSKDETNFAIAMKTSNRIFALIITTTIHLSGTFIHVFEKGKYNIRENFTNKDIRRNSFSENVHNKLGPDIERV